MSNCLFLSNSMSSFSRKNVYGSETKQYSTEMRGLAEYYKIANNFKKALWGKIYKLWSESYSDNSMMYKGF